MPAFDILAKVDQIVTKEVRLLIEARDAEEATAKARAILADYPSPIAYDPMIHRVVTQNSKYWIPRSIEFIDIKEDIEEDEAAPEPA